AADNMERIPIELVNLPDRLRRGFDQGDQLGSDDLPTNSGRGPLDRLSSCRLIDRSRPSSRSSRQPASQHGLDGSRASYTIRPCDPLCSQRAGMMRFQKCRPINPPLLPSPSRVFLLYDFRVFDRASKLQANLTPLRILGSLVQI